MIKKTFFVGIIGQNRKLGWLSIPSKVYNIEYLDKNQPIDKWVSGICIVAIVDIVDIVAIYFSKTTMCWYKDISNLNFGHSRHSRELFFAH